MDNSLHFSDARIPGIRSLKSYGLFAESWATPCQFTRVASAEVLFKVDFVIW